MKNIIDERTARNAAAMINQSALAGFIAQYADVIYDVDEDGKTITNGDQIVALMMAIRDAEDNAQIIRIAQAVCTINRVASLYGRRFIRGLLNQDLNGAITLVKSFAYSVAYYNQCNAMAA